MAGGSLTALRASERCLWGLKRFQSGGRIFQDSGAATVAVLPVSLLLSRRRRPRCPPPAYLPSILASVSRGPWRTAHPGTSQAKRFQGGS